MSLPAARHLGISLRKFVDATTALGHLRGWHPTAASELAVQWAASASEATSDSADLRARTLLEADVHGLLLLRSALEHSDAVAEAVLRGQSFVPHSTARIAVEHALRGWSLLDDSCSDEVRSIRRLHEWLNAANQPVRLSRQFLQLGVETGWVKADEDERKHVLARISELGFTIAGKSPHSSINGRQRPNIYELIEEQLAGSDGVGVPTLLLHLHHGAVHAEEVALVRNAELWSTPLGVNVLLPKRPEASTSAFELLLVPLAVVGAVRLLVRRFRWDQPATAALKSLTVAEGRMLTNWQTLSHAYEASLGDEGGAAD